ncbi:alpha-1,2-fucosyltransferase [uncultured Salegentibacter sp.]|uniref:alpha-1,2-fucosyltransferase n=1 Tax=uncultured Salegentibacter sp. TaxID=259320 RepID=UPI00259A8E69|nr:alpha-1,2-fucosyltransferase [uncultured Salegentibacter sp.]
MIVTKITGGLGNQMFQYAVALILAKKNKTSIYIDDTFYQNNNSGTIRNFELPLFKHNLNVATPDLISDFTSLSVWNKLKREAGLNYPKIHNEKNFAFDKKTLELQAPVYLQGYFQSYKYFKGFEKQICDFFSFPENRKDEQDKKILTNLKYINSVAVHVRRGDYITDKKTQKFHGNCTKEYYLEAIETIAKQTANPYFFFFSDDPDWGEQNFNHLPYNITFVTQNQGKDSWKDMMLMSSCKHNIIANSSFSWWGAWLNRNPDKIIIAPKKWFAFSKKESDNLDLIPLEWIKIKN